MMRRIASFMMAASFIFSFATSSAAAVTIQTSPPPATAPDILVTSILGYPLLDDLEIFNQSDSPVSLAGWSLAFTIKGGGACSTGKVATVAFPSAWMLSKHYFTFVRGGAAGSPGAFSVDPGFLDGCTTPGLASVQLLHGDEIEQGVTVLDSKGVASTLAQNQIAQHKQRNNSLSSTRTVSGDFTKDYTVTTVSATTALYSDPLYTPPIDDGGLQILEILPNARNCSPTESDVTCGDYVKLYNPTETPVNLAQYRLRIGYGGQSTSVTNTFSWGQSLDPAKDELVLQPHAYFTLTKRNDGQPLSVTDTGNYVWIEDAYGVHIYEPVVQYPDASSTTKVGQAWAFDGAQWNWTAAPQPDGPNYFPPEALSAASVSIEPLLKPCAAGQYRNPATNRCNSVDVTTSSLAPCQPGQVRNPDTNRCRSVLGASTTLSTCPAGQERNPDTNRCRKVAAGIAKVQDVKTVGTTATGSKVGWIVAAVAIACALAYGVYEWRQDMGLLLSKMKSKLLLALPRWLLLRRYKQPKLG